MESWHVTEYEQQPEPIHRNVAKELYTWAVMHHTQKHKKKKKILRGEDDNDKLRTLGPHKVTLNEEPSRFRNVGHEEGIG